MSSVQVANSLQMGSVDTPLDARTRIPALTNVPDIALPYIGMVFFCSATGRHYKVKTLKSKQIGAAVQPDAAIDTYEPVPDQSDLAGKAAKEHTHADYALKTELPGGVGNVLDGYAARVTAFNAESRTITLESPAEDEELDMSKFTAGASIRINAAESYVEGETLLWQENIIAAVDAGNKTVTLTADPSDAAALSDLFDGRIFVRVDDPERLKEDAASASGSKNFVVGARATASGSWNTVTGMAARADGMQNVVSGDGSSAAGVANLVKGDNSRAVGTANEVQEAMSFVVGSGNKAKAQGQIIAGTMNEVAAINATVIGVNNKDVSGYGAVVIGSNNGASGKNSVTFGGNLRNHAEGGTLTGRYAELEDSAENRGAFAVGGGEHGAETVSFIHRVCRAEENPLFDPSTSGDASAPNPKDGSGERKYNSVPGYSTEYRGSLRAMTGTLTAPAAGATGTTPPVVLDVTQYSRFHVVAPAGNGVMGLALFELADTFRDGDRCEVVIDTTKVIPNFPSEWVTPGADVTTTPGLYVIEIAMVESTVFYKVLWPDSQGSGSSSQAPGICDVVKEVTLPGTTNVVTLDSALTPAWFRSPDGIFYNALMCRISGKTEDTLTVDLTAITEDRNETFLSGKWTVYFAGGGLNGEAATIESVSASFDDSVNVPAVVNTGTVSKAKLQFKFPRKIFTDSAETAYRKLSSLLYQAGLVTNPNEFPPELVASLPEIPEVTPDSMFYPSFEAGEEPVVATGNQVWYVYPNGQGNADGSSWSNAMANIKDAIAAAVSGDVIYVMEGSYPLVSPVTLKAGVSMYGGFTDEGRSWATRSPFLHRSTFDASGLAVGFSKGDGSGASVVNGIAFRNMKGPSSFNTMKFCVLEQVSGSWTVVADGCLLKNCGIKISGDIRNSTVLNSSFSNYGDNAVKTVFINCDTGSETYFTDKTTNSLFVNCNGGVYSACSSTFVRCTNANSQLVADESRNSVFFLCEKNLGSSTVSCASTSHNVQIKLSSDNTQTRFIDLGTVTETGPVEIADPETFDWSQFGNFRPADSYSALVGAGTYDSTVTTDADGNPRPNPPSIGAYEVPLQE